MKVLLLEACRSPEVRKPLTEPLVLSQFFSRNGIEYELLSNDGIWEHRVEVDKALLRSRLQEALPDVVHLAVHGGHEGLVLRWSNAPFVGDRVPVELLTPDDIRSMAGFGGRLVVSGGCSSAQFASDFLMAGATAFVAPLADVPWTRIGLFFESFYLSYWFTAKPSIALGAAVHEFPEYRSYRVFDGQSGVATQ